MALYWPSLLVVSEREMPVSVSVTRTVAFGMAAPLASVTVPVMLPTPEVWADSGRTVVKPSSAVEATATSRFFEQRGFIWRRSFGKTPLQ